jgi:hypothetical protein
MDPTLLKYWQGEQQDVQDLRRKFKNTAVLAELYPGTKHALIEPIRITGFGDYTVQVDSATNRALVLELEQVRVLKATPNTGIYDFPEQRDVVIVKRTALRQFVEGTGHENVRLWGSSGNILTELTWPLLANLFTQQVDRTLDDVEALGEGCSRLTKNCWVRRGKEKVELFRQFYKIGTWDLGRWYFNSKAVKLLSEEMKDELKFHAKQ